MRSCCYLSLLGLFALLSISSSAMALDVTGQSRTYLISQETADTTQLMPLYEYLNFKVDDAATNPVSFNFGGWYRYDLKEASYNGRSDENLQYAYLSFKKWNGNAALNIGRMRVNEGVMSMPIDGIYARTDLKGGITVAAYGGSPVETESDGRTGDSIIGGRISEWIEGLLILGLTYQDEQNDRKPFRREGSVDIWLRPLPTLVMQGMSTYNEIQDGWMMHNYYATIGPFYELRLNLEYSKVDYEQFFQSMTVSAFTFPNIDPKEKMEMTGGSLEYAATSMLSLIGDYKHYEYTIAGPADYYGGKIVYTGDSFGAGLYGHRMDGSTDSLRYTDIGIYATQKIAQADFALQLFRIAYDQRINGVKYADSDSLAVGYALSPKARIAADVQYNSTPDLKDDVRVMAKFIYSFDAHYETGKKSAQAAGTGAASGRKP